MTPTALIAIPSVIAGFTGLLGWFTVHNRSTTLYWIALWLSVAASLAFFYGLMTVPGWDALTYGFFLVLGSLPAMGALVLGGGIGMMTRPRCAIPS